MNYMRNIHKKIPFVSGSRRGSTPTPIGMMWVRELKLNELKLKLSRDIVGTSLHFNL